MSLFSFILGAAVGAVFGAKHQAMTLFFYDRIKPFLIKTKNRVVSWLNK